MVNMFQELKRRKVFRVAAVYAVVAWLLIQVADVVLPALQLPPWTVTFITVLFMLGFPIAVILAWAYEVSPEGIRADTGANAKRSSAGSPATANQGLLYATFALVLLVAGIQLVNTFGGGSATIAPADNALANTSSALPPASVMRAAINLDHELTRNPNSDVRTSLQLAGDGSQLFYTVYSGTGSTLHARDLADQSTRAREITLATPRLSPGGDRFVGAVLGRPQFAIHRVSGGVQQTIDATWGVSPVTDWLSENEILYTPGGFSQGLGLRRLSLLSGEASNGTQAETLEAQLNPWVLPGSGAFLFNSLSSYASGNEADIRVHDLGTGVSRTLVNGGYLPRYALSGHLVFIRQGNLWAAPFDLDSRELTGPEVQVIEGIESYPRSFYASLAFSDNGRLVYLPGEEYETFESRLFWADRSGAREEIRLPPGSYSDPELSPSGELLALTINQADGSSDIWTHDFSRGTLTRLTLSGDARNPKWSPDNTTVVYQIPGQGIWQVRANGTGQAEQLVTQADARPDSFSIEGETLFYLQGAVGDSDIMRLDFRDGTWLSTPLLAESYSEWGSAVSPDGNWIAYVSTESGPPEVFVRPYPNIEDGKWQISTATGREPKWSVQGDELFYLQMAEPALMSVTIDTANGFDPSIPRILFTDIDINQPDPPSYAVSGGGERFIYYPRSEPGESEEANEANEANGLPHFIVVENWFDELNRLAPPSEAR